MRLVFTRRAGKMHCLRVERADGTVETVDAPEQGIIPHDMVHFAVETRTAARGFLTMVAGGDRLAFETSGGVQEEAVERLVEAFQSALWSGSRAPAAVRYAFDTACEARGHEGFAVSDAEIAAVFASLDDLGKRWRALGVGDEMVLDFTP